MPAPPAALMVPPLRPAPPEGGTVRQLLHHAATFGGYVQELENQNAAWREWVRAGMDAGLRRHDGKINGMTKCPSRAIPRKLLIYIDFFEKHSCTSYPSSPRPANPPKFCPECGKPFGA